MEVGNHSVRVNVQARDFWCEGDIIVPRPNGYKSRVIDLLNGNTAFLALTDVLVHRASEGDAEDPVPYDVLLLRKGEIEFVVPLD